MYTHWYSCHSNARFQAFWCSDSGIPELGLSAFLALDFPYIYNMCNHTYKYVCVYACRPGMVAESVDNRSHVWEIVGSNPSWVKPMTYQIDTCRFKSWCWQPGFPVGQHYKITMSVHCHKSVPILIWAYMLLGHKTTNNMRVYIYIYMWMYICICIFIHIYMFMPIFMCIITVNKI